MADDACKGALPDRIADECDLHGKALLKVAVVDGSVRGVTILLTVDDAKTHACLRRQALGANFEKTQGLSRCVRTFRQPDEEIFEFPEAPVNKETDPSWMAEPWDLKWSPQPWIGPDPGPGFDVSAAKRVLAAIPYRDCGKGGPGKVTITFATNGWPKRAAVTAGAYDAATRACIETRFRGAKVPAFAGGPK